MKNDTKNLLLHLYGEAERESDLRSLMGNPELKSEYTALSEAKFRLDLKKKDRPDPAVIDTIMSAARTGGQPSPALKRVDRGPIFRIARYKRMLFPAIGMAAVLLLSIGVLWVTSPTGTTSPSGFVAMEDDAIVPPESLYRFVPSLQPAATSPIPQSDPLAWDDGETLHNLSGRISTIKPSDLLDWGESAVPLERLPDNNRPGFQTVGSNRN